MDRREDIPVWKHLANSLLVSAPVTPVAPVFLPVAAFLPPAGRDVAPGWDVAAEEGYTLVKLTLFIAHHNNSKLTGCCI